ncbi:ATP synthase subunit s, mitochondrial [Musca vetustissima]|uniref:ATP synthase subunit s, mitochondrial n=1 Tax=Musca vetustissima TaxID=27455 RepID=UPI002AB7A804|nr:ATP synthase subunit s, mitochondrial [Musca vetustissima]
MLITRPLNLLKCGFLTTKHLWNTPPTTAKNSSNASRQLWGYVAIAFNRVDVDRQQLVGADRLCAEWVIKNGGGICTVDAPTRLINNYNILPPEHYRFKVKVVDGSGASLMKIGLDHFKGCNHIDTVIFHKCKHLESDGLSGLVHLKDTLKSLQVSECDNISDDCFAVIEELKNLQELRIFNMRYVKNLDAIIDKLKKTLPKCRIETAEKNDEK